MSRKQATFDVPEKEPWKDRDTLDGLYHDENKNQTEIAEYFGDLGHEVTASSISYWMKKLEVETTHNSYEDSIGELETLECVNFEECGNQTPGPKNLICNTCLDKARQKK